MCKLFLYSNIRNSCVWSTYLPDLDCPEVESVCWHTVPEAWRQCRGKDSEMFVVFSVCAHMACIHSWWSVVRETWQMRSRPSRSCTVPSWRAYVMVQSHHSSNTVAPFRCFGHRTSPRWCQSLPYLVSTWQRCHHKSYSMVTSCLCSESELDALLIKSYPF